MRVDDLQREFSYRWWGPHGISHLVENSQQEHKSAPLIVGRHEAQAALRAASAPRCVMQCSERTQACLQMLVGKDQVSRITASALFAYHKPMSSEPVGNNKMSSIVIREFGNDVEVDKVKAWLNFPLGVSAALEHDDPGRFAGTPDCRS